MKIDYPKYLVHIFLSFKEMKQPCSPQKLFEYLKKLCLRVFCNKYQSPLLICADNTSMESLVESSKHRFH